MMAAYATGEDLVKRYDVDLIGDLCSDGREPLSPGEVTDHENVLTALLDASGEVDSALMAGGRYSPEQLALLTDNTKSKLINIVCAIGMSILVSRRAGKVELDLADQLAKQSRAHLAALQRGENVFGVPNVQGASVVELATLSVVETDQLNLLPTRMSSYFPSNQQRRQF